MKTIRHRRPALVAACALLAASQLHAADENLLPIAFQNGVDQQTLGAETAELARTIDSLIDELQRNGFPLQSLTGLSELAGQLNALGGAEMTAIASRLRQLGENTQTDPRATATEAYRAQQLIESRLKALARKISIQQLRDESARRLQTLISRQVTIQRETRAIASAPDAERQQILESDQTGIGNDLATFFETGQSLLNRLSEPETPTAAATPAPGASFSDRINGGYLNTLSTEAVEHIKSNRYPDAYARQGALIVELNKILQGILSSLPKEQRLANALQQVAALRQQEEAREQAENPSEKAKETAAQQAEKLANEVAQISPEAAEELRKAQKAILEEEEQKTASKDEKAKEDANKSKDEKNQSKEDEQLAKNEADKSKDKNAQDEKNANDEKTANQEDQLAKNEAGSEKAQDKNAKEPASEELASNQQQNQQDAQQKDPSAKADAEAKTDEKGEKMASNQPSENQSPEQNKNGEQEGQDKPKSAATEALAAAEKALQKALAQAQDQNQSKDPNAPQTAENKQGSDQKQQQGQQQPQQAQQPGQQMAQQSTESSNPSSDSEKASQGGSMANIPGKGDASGDPVQVVGALRPEEREAFSALQNERYPAEYSAWVQQYWRNLAQE